MHTEVVKFYFCIGDKEIHDEQMMVHNMERRNEELRLEQLATQREQELEEAMRLRIRESKLRIGLDPNKGDTICLTTY